MDRLEKFNSLKTHAWYKRQFAKLRKSDLDFCVNFIDENKSLDKIGFWNKLKMQRCKSDKKADISRFNICIELLDCSKDI